MNIQDQHLTKGVTSPFLPGTNVMYAWDSTCLGMLKTCPRLYQYVIIDGYSSKAESVHLRWGQEYHSALEDYDKQIAAGADRATAIREAVRSLLIRTHGWEPEIDDEKRSEKLKTKAHLVRSVIDYLDHFQDDAAETYIMGGGEPAVELSFRLELDWGPTAYQKLEPGEISLKPGALNYIDGAEEPSGQPYLLCGHLDRVVNFQDSLFVMDRKTTTTTLGSYYFDQFQPNNQMTLYTLAGKIVLHSPIKGVIIDAVQILSDSSRFVRGFTYRTPDQLEEWQADLRYWLSQAERFAVAGYWPMNDLSCDKFGGCKFRTICGKSPQVREQFLKANFIKLDEQSRWNPMASRNVK